MEGFTKCPYWVRVGAIFLSLFFYKWQVYKWLDAISGDYYTEVQLQYFLYVGTSTVFYTSSAHNSLLSTHRVYYTRETLQDYYHILSQYSLNISFLRGLRGVLFIFISNPLPIFSCWSLKFVSSNSLVPHLRVERSILTSQMTYFVAFQALHQSWIYPLQHCKFKIVFLHFKSYTTFSIFLILTSMSNTASFERRWLRLADHCMTLLAKVICPFTLIHY